MKKNLRALIMVLVATFTAMGYATSSIYADEINADAGSVIEVKVNKEVQSSPVVNEPAQASPENAGSENTEVKDTSTSETGEKQDTEKTEVNTNKTELQESNDKEVLKETKENSIEKTPTSDAKTVKLSKTETNKSGELSGAEIKLVKGDSEKGEEVSTWTSGDKPKELVLEPGTYTMIEVNAPEGYKLAKPITFTVESDSKIKYNDKFIGYTNLDEYKEYGFKDAFYIKQKDSDGKGTVVYCFNRTLLTPSSISGTKYTRVIGNKDLFSSKAKSPRLTGEDLNKAVLKVIYNGYPNDNMGLKEQYGLSDAEFRRATQYAIWYYSDSDERQNYSGAIVGKKASVQEENAYKALIGKSLVVAPDNMTLDIYVPDSGSYQNLLGTRFIEPMMINLENERIEGYVKTEEPKSEEPKSEEPKIEEPKTETPVTRISSSRRSGGGSSYSSKTEEPKKEEPKTEEPKVEESKEEKINKIEFSGDKKEKEDLSRKTDKNTSVEKKVVNNNDKKFVKTSSVKTLPTTSEGLSINTYLLISAVLGAGILFFGVKSKKTER